MAAACRSSLLKYAISHFDNTHPPKNPSPASSIVFVLHSCRSKRTWPDRVDSYLHSCGLTGRPPARHSHRHGELEAYTGPRINPTLHLSVIRRCNGRDLSWMVEAVVAIDPQKHQQILRLPNLFCTNLRSAYKCATN